MKTSDQSSSKRHAVDRARDIGDERTVAALPLLLLGADGGEGELRLLLRGDVRSRCRDSRRNGQRHRRTACPTLCASDSDAVGHRPGGIRSRGTTGAPPCLRRDASSRRDRGSDRQSRSVSCRHSRLLEFRRAGDVAAEVGESQIRVGFPRPVEGRARHVLKTRLRRLQFSRTPTGRAEFHAAARKRQ